MSVIEQTREHVAELKRRLEVEQAFLDGKEIECRSLGSDISPWMKCPYPQWHWERTDYRVKREPRRWWMNVDSDGFGTGHASRKVADEASTINVIECIEVVEVLK